ncbi:MAG: hypothetical protein IJR47_01365 [Clostridia bacterium]|nr:hypothetical protein [Clostridia bacterium]
MNKAYWQDTNIPSRLRRAIQFQINGMTTENGTKRHEYKLAGLDKDLIFSSRSKELLEKRMYLFAKYAYAVHNANTIQKLKACANDYIQNCIDRGASPRTMASYASAICKFFGKDKAAFIGKTPACTRASITKGRGGSPIREQGFDFEKNRLAVEIFIVTGLREREFKDFRGGDYLGFRTGVFNNKVIKAHWVKVN